MPLSVLRVAGHQHGGRDLRACSADDYVGLELQVRNLTARGTSGPRVRQGRQHARLAAPPDAPYFGLSAVTCSRDGAQTPSTFEKGGNLLTQDPGN